MQPSRGLIFSGGYFSAGLKASCGREDKSIRASYVRRTTASSQLAVLLASAVITTPLSKQPEEKLDRRETKQGRADRPK